MIDKVKNTIKENEMFNLGDKVVVAVSGGPDSMCLLHILYTLREELKISLIAAHLNHCLRGEDADEDERCVEELCKKMGIKFCSKRVDVNKLGEEKGLSCEMAGREARYEFFEEICKKYNAHKVAIAHNANDQAETILMRMMRGTGLEGLIGIRPVRDEIYVRPIIKITRNEIEKYCIEHKLNPRIDKTNLENIYSRNKVRLELLPYMQKNFNEDIVNTLNRMSDVLKRDNEYLEEESLKKYNLLCKKEEGKLVVGKEAFLEKEAILTRILRNAINKVLGNLYNIEKSHIDDIIEIQKHPTGKEVQLPKNIIARNNYGDIYLYINRNVKSDININKVLTIDKNNIIKPLNKKITLHIVPKDEKIDFKSKAFTKYFDYDKINGEILVRFRKNGDTIVPLGMSGRKKLKDIFIDLKIPREDRNSIPLICFGEEVAWIVGYKVSEKFKVDKTTNNILEINIESEEAK